MSDADKRQAYEKKVAAQMAAWNAEIDKLKARARQADAAARIRYHEALESLEKQRSAAQSKLEELRSSGAEAWERVRSGVESAWAEFKDALDKAKEQFQ
jgi:hypothetical protein